MTLIPSFHWRSALAAVVLMSGVALTASCAGTLDEDEWGDAGGGTDGQGPTGGTTATGTGGAPATTGAGPGVTSGDATTGASVTTGDATTGATTATTGAGGNNCGDVPAMITEACGKAGCHDATTKLANLSLVAGWESSVKGQASSCGGMVLAPGNPEGSSLYTKVTPSPPCNSRMPIGDDPLNDEQIACLRDFITALPP